MNALIAKTHPAEYLIHKYWARKPHNILAHYIEKYFKTGDTILDPFSGSGVFLAESQKRNLDIIGYDINPLAYLLTEVTVNPPDIQDFQREADRILNHIRDNYNKWYEIDKVPIRFAVHNVRSKCSNCKTVNSVHDSRRQGAKYFCKKCNNKISFNFENFDDTEIIAIIDKNNTKYTQKNILNKQKKLSEKFQPMGDFNKSLLINRRILAFPDMKLSDLFTARAYSILSGLFYQAHKIKNKKTRNAILLFLTSGVAQCSRLIPYRNNLKTGGPAWTVPGFWIAPVHLETNPVIHFEARYKKFIKGLNFLNKNYKNRKKTSAKIELLSAQEGIKKIQNNSLDGIFFDPPYGDNVPYVEFSEIWNGFLRYKVDYEREIVVSDRKKYLSSWDKYTKDIEEVVGLFYEKLKPNGCIIMTFNNLDPRAWKIVLNAFRNQSLHCVEAEYQIPAVISSKAQRASNTSYIGDYYCVFKKVDKIPNINSNIYQLTDKLKKLFYSRNGVVPQNLVNRMAILSILNENMNLEFLSKIEEAVTPIATKEKEYYKLRPELINVDLMEKFNINKIITSIAIKELREGKKSLINLYKTIIKETDELGSPSVSEVKTILKPIVLFEKDYCYLQNLNSKQISLF